MSSLPDTTVEENTNKGPSPLSQPKKKQRMRKSVTLSKQGKVKRSRRMRVLPNQSQREILRDCMGIYRHIYNECVCSDRNGLIHGASVTKSSRWRTLLTKRSISYNLGQYWKDKCPCHPKKQAVEECFKAKKTGMMMVSTGNILPIST
ncbi:unnamed protein product [Laminaria digitata]